MGTARKTALNVAREREDASHGEKRPGMKIPPDGRGRFQFVRRLCGDFGRAPPLAVEVATGEEYFVRVAKNGGRLAKGRT